MAGDGINGAPALGRGRCGDRDGYRHRCRHRERRVTLVKGDLWASQEPRGRRAVMRNIRQNLFFAFIYNAVGVPVAAGLLYPFTGSLLADDRGRRDELSSVSVIPNALRLHNIRLK